MPTAATAGAAGLRLSSIHAVDDVSHTAGAEHRWAAEVRERAAAGRGSASRSQVARQLARVRLTYRTGVPAAGWPR